MSADFKCQLANRGIVALGGADRRGFLQGLISNDIELCREGQALYAALLTPQGKFLHDLFIIESGEEFLIDCESARAEDLLKRLAAYKLRAKVTLRDARAEFEVWAMGGQGAEVGDQRFFTDLRLSELGMRAILRKGDPRPLAPEPRTFLDYDRHRLALGVADGSRDMIVEKSTLTDGNFDLLNGISWTKGCYVGQELTARMHYRALAKKRMFPVKIEGDAPVFGASVTFRGEDIGDMRSSVGDVGLVLLNVEKAEMAMRDNALMECGRSKLKIYRPDWMEIKG